MTKTYFSRKRRERGTGTERCKEKGEEEGGQEGDKERRN